MKPQLSLVSANSAVDMQQRVSHILDEIRHSLPAQGPIQVFIHHNTLHAFEGEPFESAVERQSALRHAEPYLSHESFLEEEKRGRISGEAIERALKRALDLSHGPNVSFLNGRISREKLWKLLLQIPERIAPDETFDWMVSEQFPDPTAQEIWAMIKYHVEQVGPHTANVTSLAQRSLSRLDERMVTLCSTYLDQGMSYWPMPGREKGFLAAVRQLFPEINHDARPATEVIADELQKRGLPDKEWATFLTKESLALSGWAGTFSVIEARPHLLPEKFPKASLAEYLAVRLLLQRQERAVEKVEKKASVGRYYPSFTIFRLFQRLGWTASEVSMFSNSEWKTFVAEVTTFGDIARRRVFQQAYEDHFNTHYLSAIIENGRRNRAAKVKSAKPVAYQAVFCIDEREESFQRHLNETSDELETYAVAGFFGVDMWYQGLGDSQPAALCPVVITPKHLVREAAIDLHSRREQIKLKRLRLSQRLATQLYDHSRNLLIGWWFAAIAGVAAALPLFARILSPRLYTRFNHYFTSLWFPSVETDLLIAREQNKSDPTESATGLLSGFNLEEMALRVEGILRAIDLTHDFAPMVFILGHGSASLNNPHESAYDCGACGGARGGPNARAFARMANLPSVRQRLTERGITIPDTTHFVGGMHNTCSDSLVFFDTGKIPESKRADFEKANEIFNVARAANAQERCRRFEDASHLSAKQALIHVERRAQDLREPRPEYGHSTNAVTVVGRRALTKYLYLDRRSFLSTYNSASDPEGTILAGILGAVIPVCSGISLEYYFSRVDNEVYGCGTKLPHNVTSLLGVMNGRLSDLRTGLTWQMVEIHEPMRAVFIIEAPREKVEPIIERHPMISNLVKNRWIQIALIHPDTGACEIRRDGEWIAYPKEEMRTLTEVTSSRAYYAGKSEHLWPVRLSRGSK